MITRTPRAVTWLLKAARTRTSPAWHFTSASTNQRLCSSSASSSSPKQQLPTVTLYTKDNCPLCDYARTALKPFMHRLVLEEVDITAPQHSEWFDEYRYDIPVVHLNGDFVMWHRVNPELLETKLTELEAQVAGD